MKKLYIVSVGSGGLNYITSEAINAIKDSEVIVSYSKYARELEELLFKKELYTSGMTHEVDRCKKAIEYAQEGKTTSIISNGDANVFGVASIVFEIIDKENLWEEIEIISLPGVTALLATASKVGAPISKDFAVISLSDKINSLDSINKKVKLALEADFTLGLYSPKTKLHFKPFMNLLDILKAYEERIVLIASHIGRNDKEKVTVTNTQELIDKGLENDLITMSTLIIICNSNTHLTKNGLVLTSK